MAEPNDELSTANKRDITEISIYGICILVFSLGILFNYAYVSQSLNLKLQFEPGFWNPLAIVGCLTNLFSAILIILNMYHNFYYRNHFEKQSIPNQEILYLICLPSLIIALIGLSLILLKELIINDKASLGKELFAISSIIFFLTLLSLLIDANMFEDVGEIWIINITNMSTILFTIIALINNLIFPIYTAQIAMYISALNMTEDTSNYSALYFSMQTLFQWNDVLLNKIIVILDISCAFFLINPLIFHLNQIQKSKKIFDTAVEVNTDNNEQIISIGSLVLSCFFIVAIVVSILIDALASDSAELINLLVVITYIASFVHMYCMLEDIKKCSRKPNVNPIHYVFMWMGLFGQFIQSISGLHVGIRLTFTDKHLYSWVRILQYVTQVIECFGQNICITLIIERKWKCFNKKKWFSFLSCPLFLICTNISFMFLSFYLLYNSQAPSNSEYFYVRLFESGFNYLGMVFSVLHRGHAAIVLLFYFKYYMRNDPAEYTCYL